MICQSFRPQNFRSYLSTSPQALRFPSQRSFLEPFNRHAPGSVCTASAQEGAAERQRACPKPCKSSVWLMQAQQRAAEMRAARLEAERAAIKQREQEQAALSDTARQERLRRVAANQAATAEHLQVQAHSTLHGSASW